MSGRLDQTAKALQRAAEGATAWVEATNGGEVPPGKEWTVTVVISATRLVVSTGVTENS